MDFTQEEKEYFMAQALIEAQKAADHEEVPIGAVIVKDGEIIARSYNARELHQKATHHAEICAIDMANDFVGNWRLLDCALFVTIEPCVMCSGAISLARLPQVYFGATNPKFGGAVSLYQILEDKRLNHRLHVESGILEEECAQMMQNFFKNRRKK
ncbi:MAG: tRNA adenosine(34) deaminase TadA [Pseudolactococcus laudensis]|uniref:tRNA-specific adenosine deaminase n=1 Tax=Pseudolactococcus laudensis TaxID=1494461 RepID=A0A7V8N0G0_9LACT|nr:tRNA adenosine(34) deaminase TadA [Lactococcus laudensis]MBA0016414.1 nucleoside deaminase [Lactococcus laudensis]MBW9281036.1 nucleoside deaminase [Lactococcus laudensis]